MNARLASFSPSRAPCIMPMARAATSRSSTRFGERETAPIPDAIACSGKVHREVRTLEAMFTACVLGPDSSALIHISLSLSRVRDFIAWRAKALIGSEEHTYGLQSLIRKSFA